ncbi:MAG: BlaI/MecI/CopY family transcriptional regulator [Clostridia bacterium]|nr:BlaI/MecI/CopY family transcriptional regulator [Clostridia bacterium]
MEYIKLFDAEYRVMQIIWESEPLTSRELAEICLKELNWQRTTTYTMLKKLIKKGYAQNDKKIVSSLISKKEVQKNESKDFVEKNFAGSLYSFIAAFTSDNKLEEEEIKKIKKLISDSKK